MKKYLYALFFALLLTNANAQEKSDKKFTFKLNGFVRTDMIYDTRLNKEARDAYFAFFPLDEKLNSEGEDLNAQSGLNLYGMASRLRASISGPKAFGANTKAIMEGDFTGPNNLNNNGFRLRLAYMNLEWENTELLVGQYWHPFTITEAFPKVVSLNTGAPFHAFARQPQIMVKQHFNHFYLTAAISTQRDFVSPGPESGVLFNGKVIHSHKYLKASILPDMNLQIHFKTNRLTSGIAGEYKILTPRTVNVFQKPVNETVHSKAALVYAKYTDKHLTLTAQAIYGENLYDLLMMSSYAISNIDVTKDEYSYTPTSQTSLWADVDYKYNAFSAGCFFGYLKNNGADSEIVMSYNRGKNIDHLIRVSPRLSYTSGNITLYSELEMTQANYGTEQNDGTVSGERNVKNTRLTLNATYKF